MNIGQVLNKLQEILRKVFDDENLIITDDTNYEDIEEWDSYEQMNIVAEIEKNFNVKFTIDDIMGCTCISDIVEKIIQHSSACAIPKNSSGSKLNNIIKHSDFKIWNDA